MKKTAEILNKIQATKNEMTVLKNNGEVDKALLKVTEIENLQKELKIAQIEEEEIKNSVPEPIPGAKVKTVDGTKVLNKVLRGIELDSIENGMVEQIGDPNGGEFLVPVEQIQKIVEFRKTLLPLKGKCDVIPVTSPKGIMPIHILTDAALLSAEELAAVDPTDIKFSDIKYSVEDYADMVFISNQLLADSTYDVTGIITKSFARKSVRTENNAIYNVLSKCTPVAGKDNTAIDNALNVVLDPVNSLQAEILTDQDGYNYLDQLTDKVGRPLLTDSLAAPGSREYKGKIITVSRNGAFTRPAGTLMFFVGVVEESVAFFDKQDISIAVSNDFAFNKRAKAFLVTERIDTQLKDPNGVVVVSIPVPTEQVVSTPKITV